MLIAIKNCDSGPYRSLWTFGGKSNNSALVETKKQRGWSDILYIYIQCIHHWLYVTSLLFIEGGERGWIIILLLFYLT